MEEYNSVEVNALIEETTQSSLEDLLRAGARHMLQTALEMEVSAYLDGCKDQHTAAGHQAVVSIAHAGPARGSAVY
jgi:hypothetical protein